MSKFEILSDSVEDLWELVLRLEHSVENLQRTRFTAPEPEPACKQNQEWMLNELEEQELERDISLVKDD